VNRSFDDVPIRASLLDRLQENGIDQGIKSGRQNLRGLIRSVHDHVEALLNTRWRAIGGVDEQNELDRSLINYGIPDFSTISVASPEGQERFKSLVEAAIRLHEPRFLDVNVEIVEKDDGNRTLHFRIGGELHAKPDHTHVTFDLTLDPTDQRIRLGATDNV
jgi:type VI secretion system protein ImpF